MRPKTSRARGANVCAPSDTRLMPASRYPANLPRSMVPGLASRVTSTSSANAIRCRNAPSRRLKSSGWNKLGVPPPKNTVSILRPLKEGSSRSKSPISASMYEVSGAADFNWCELKSQYGHLRTHQGMCTYKASEGSSGPREASGPRDASGSRDASAPRDASGPRDASAPRDVSGPRDASGPGDAAVTADAAVMDAP